MQIERKSECFLLTKTRGALESHSFSFFFPNVPSRYPPPSIPLIEFLLCQCTVRECIVNASVFDILIGSGPVAAALVLIKRDTSTTQLQQQKSHKSNDTKNKSPKSISLYSNISRQMYNSQKYRPNLRFILPTTVSQLVQWA